MLARFGLAALLLVPALPAQDAQARREADLQILLEILKPTNEKITGRINAHDRNWRGWQARTGELPPDFASMPSRAALPDPFVLDERGQSVEVATDEQWRSKRVWIREQFEQWVYGKVPPAPKNLRATVTGETADGDLTIRSVLLEFGPERRAKLRLELILPPGEGPFPVFLTNHARTRPWLSSAVRRSYIACVYFAADPRYGYEDDSESYIEAYPDHDFSTVARWGWSAGRAVDYLQTLPQVDAEKIALTGHSRNGKQALFAAAFDERIGAAVPSSGNTGEGDPWRYTSDIFRNETIEQITGNFPHWFHSRLRFFVGREHKLPVDQNLLMALVAPRGLMLATAYSETQGNTFGFEQAYKSVGEVYEFLGAEQNLGLYVRPGIHATTAGVIEEYLDFFDTVFDRNELDAPEDWTHNYDFEQWTELSDEEIDPEEYDADHRLMSLNGRAITTPANWAKRRADIQDRIHWALGKQPPGVTFPARTALDGLGLTSAGWLAELHGRPLKLEGGGATALPFGDDLSGELYYPGVDGRPARANLPVVVWLHPHAYPTGYSRYARRQFEALIARGYAVFAFDQIGFGSRVLDAGRFYQRYPRWSLLGKMAADTSAAVAAMVALGESGVVDADKIFVVGYALGAKVGLWTAALDERIAGVAAVNGFSSLRAAAGNVGVEGIRHYSHLHGLVPRFGFFVDHERRLPIDYEEILAAVAPRPVLVSAAKLDRYHPSADVEAAVDPAREVYRLLGSEQRLRLRTPTDFNRFESDRLTEVIDWLDAQQ